MQLDKLTDSVKLNLILKTKDACPMFWMKIYKKTYPNSLIYIVHKGIKVL